jgi:GT2 family glycosyltransferase/predicted O-methyltransferase YrrM
MKSNCYGVVSIYEDQGLLPHFISHYRQLGVTHLFLCARTEEARSVAIECVREFDGFASVHYSRSEYFADSEKELFELNVLDRHKVNADDYVIHLDLDEFQEYPAPLTEVIAEMDRANHWACRGWIVDRLSADGSLQPVRSSPTIWEQFPVAADVSQGLMGSWCQKIVLCRRRVRLRGHCRHDTENAYYETAPIPGDYLVHHFKWLEGLDRRLEHRLSTGALSDAYRRECQVFLDHYSRAGRFDLSDSRLKARWPAAPYDLGKLNMTEPPGAPVSSELRGPRPSPDSALTSIIIVTFNELRYTRECVASIQERTSEPYDLIFVDNGSTDGTPEYLDGVVGACVIRNSSNRGFPAAVNQGLKAARGVQVLLLNNDVVVCTGWLGRMVSALESNPNVGLVGPCSNSVSGSQQIPVSYSDISDLDAFAWGWGIRHDAEREETNRLIGFCLLIRKAVVDQVGGMDERFGVGCFEDDDFCTRAIRNGWTAVIARDAFVHHYGSRTFAASGIDYPKLLQDNARKYRAKWDTHPKGADASDLWEYVAFDMDGMRETYRKLFHSVPVLPFPTTPAAGFRYYSYNDWFPLSDALVLSAFIQTERPRRIIEIGCGFSTAVILDTLEHAGQASQVTCVDPDLDRMRALLSEKDIDNIETLNHDVQHIPLSLFDGLQCGDIIVVDSSHIASVGSDVEHIILGILPRLRSGVMVHFHDIFYPYAYPDDWVRDGRGWNESLFLRAFLIGNDSYQIVAFNSYAGTLFQDLFVNVTHGLFDAVGGSIWLRRVS